jgi:hypothetical protein
MGSRFIPPRSCESENSRHRGNSPSLMRARWVVLRTSHHHRTQGAYVPHRAAVRLGWIHAPFAVTGNLAPACGEMPQQFPCGRACASHDTKRDFVRIAASLRHRDRWRFSENKSPVKRVASHRREGPPAHGQPGIFREAYLRSEPASLSRSIFEVTFVTPSVSRATAIAWEICSIERAAPSRVTSPLEFALASNF